MDTKDKGQVAQDEINTNEQYHAEAVAINSMMQHPGWSVFMERWERKKKALQERTIREEIDIEVGGIEKKGENITLVILNKDENKIKLAFLKLLEREFRELQLESARQPEANDE